MSESYEKDSGNRESEHQNGDDEIIAFSSGGKTEKERENLGDQNESKHVYRKYLFISILHDYKTFWKSIYRKSKSTCTNMLHSKCRSANDTESILSVLKKTPSMMTQFDNNGFLPSSIMAESNSKLAIEFARKELLFSTHNHLYWFILKNIFPSHLKFPSYVKKKEDLLKLAEAFEEKANHVFKFKIIFCNLQLIFKLQAIATNNFCIDSFLEENMGKIDNENEIQNYLNFLMEEIDDENQIQDIIRHLFSCLEENKIMEETYGKMLEDFLDSLIREDDKINDFSDFLALQEEEEIKNFLMKKVQENNLYLKELLINYYYWKEVVYERFHKIPSISWYVSDALKKLEEKENAKCAAINNVIKKLDIDENSLHDIEEENISKEEKDLFLWCYLSRRYHLLKILFPSSRFDTNLLCEFCFHVIENLRKDVKKFSVSSLQEEVARTAGQVIVKNVDDYSSVNTSRAWLLENWLCGIDPLGKRAKDSFKEDDKRRYPDFIRLLTANNIYEESIQPIFNSLSNRKEERINNENKIQDFFEQNVLENCDYDFIPFNKIKEEDTQFIQFLIEYNLLKEVVYDNLFIILPALLMNDTRYGAWPIECINCDRSEGYVRKCAFINKVMKDLGYEYFSPLKEKRNICEKEKDLLLWCCFSGRYKLVNILLRNSQFDMIPLSVFCCHVIQKLLTNSNLNSESVELMKKLNMFCQQLAKDALQATFRQCYDEKDKDTILDYFELKNPTFNHLSLLDMVVEARFSQILAVGPYKKNLSSRWYKAADVLRPFPRFILAVSSFEWLLPIYIISLLIFHKWHINDIKEDVKNMKTRYSYRNPTLWKFCMDLYQTPYIKCVKYVILHIAFLILLAYVVLSSFDAKPKDPCEIACCIYVLAYGMEEMKQMILESRSNGFCFYIKNFWNICDVIAVVTFIVGFGCRLSLLYENNSTLHSISRLFYNVSILFFSVRLLFMCTLFDNMRSKLIIIRKVVFKDVLPFLPILFLFSIPYGVAVQSMMLVNGTTYKVEEVLYNAFGFGYFALLGEFQMDNFTWDEKDEIGSISAYIFLIIFVLITNIVLLNLLIALFSKTAEAIDEEEAFLNVALLDRIEIVEEFENKSAFSPPFNILQIIVEVIFWLIFRCERNASSHNKVGVADSDENQDEVNYKCEWNFKILQAAGLRYRRENIGKLQDDQNIDSKSICKKLIKDLDTLETKLENRDNKFDEKKKISEECLNNKRDELNQKLIENVSMFEESLNNNLDEKLDKKDIKSICRKLNRKLNKNLDTLLNAKLKHNRKKYAKLICKTSVNLEAKLDTLEAKLENRDYKFEEKMKKMMEELLQSQRG